MDQEEANALPPAPAANDERTGSEDVVLPTAAALLSASFQLPTSAKVSADGGSTITIIVLLESSACYYGSAS